MTADNQGLLDAIRSIVADAIAPIPPRLDALGSRMDGLGSRMDGLDSRMDGLDSRMDALDNRMDGLEGRVDTIDTRTSHMASDILYLREKVPMLEERMDNGFRSLKSDLGLAFADIRKVNGAQERSEQSIEALRRELANVQQRLTVLERTRDAS